MNPTESDTERWETPSLAWIHEVRRVRQAQRQGQPTRPALREEAERLAKKYSLKLSAKTAVGR